VDRPDSNRAGKLPIKFAPVKPLISLTSPVTLRPLALLCDYLPLPVRLDFPLQELTDDESKEPRAPAFPHNPSCATGQRTRSEMSPAVSFPGTSRKSGTGTIEPCRSTRLEVSRLFQQAALSLGRHDLTAAARSTQRALRHLSEFPPGAPGLTLREWMVLVVQALLNRDEASCLLWMRQIRRGLSWQRGTGSENSNISEGDLCAVAGCLLAARGSLTGAGTMLTQAFVHHQSEQARDAEVRDLLLLSRVNLANGQMDECARLLDFAETRIHGASGPVDPRGLTTPGVRLGAADLRGPDKRSESHSLLQAITNDRCRLAACRGAREFRDWN
jgi:hypothetical protein